jgi:hypothetical protein
MATDGIPVAIEPWLDCKKAPAGNPEGRKEGTAEAGASTGSTNCSPGEKHLRWLDTADHTAGTRNLGSGTAT